MTDQETTSNHSNSSESANAVHLEQEQVEHLAVPCRHSRSKSSLINQLWRWLVCWPDYYQPYSWPMPVIWAIYGIIVLLVDMGTDVWVARTHYVEGHQVWAGLAVGFVVLPCVFALGYTVVIKQYYSWYQVHPIGPFYWMVKTIRVYCQQKSFCKTIHTANEATAYLNYNHEVARCETRSRYVSGDETYLEAFPECILQGYFIARLLSTVGPTDDVTYNMWLSIGVSAISLVGYESTVAYNRHYISSLYEPSILDIIARIILDLMGILPRLASLACYFTVEPREITVPSFLAAHFIFAFTWFSVTDTRRVLDRHQQALEHSHEEYRGYRTHRSKLVNNLRATVVSFLFPPTCSWHLNVSARGSTSALQKLGRGLHKQFFVISAFQFLESTALLGVWLHYNYSWIKPFYRIIVPTCALGGLLLRPIFDVICQMFFLSPITQDEVENCVRFRGVLAKTRILQLGSDIVNSLSADLLPRLHTLQKLLKDPLDDTTKQAIKNECIWMVAELAPERIVQRHVTDRSYARSPESNKTPTSPGPKTQHLFSAVGLRDVDLFIRAASVADQLQGAENYNSPEWAQEVQNLTDECEGRILAWKQVFMCCLNHQYLPSHFNATDVDPDPDDTQLFADYALLIDQNKKLLNLKTKAPIISISHM